MTMGPGANAPVPAANLRPENISSPGPDVLYQGSVLYTPPTLGFCWGWIAYYEPDRLPRMLKEVGERTAALAIKSFEVAIQAMGVREPPGEDRLALYRVKPPILWAEQQAKFPWRFEHDMADWMRLEARYGPPPATLPPEEADNRPVPEPPKRKVRKVNRNEQGRIDSIEEYDA